MPAPGLALNPAPPVRAAGLVTERPSQGKELLRLLQHAFGTAREEMLGQPASCQCAEVVLGWGFPQPEAHKHRESHPQSNGRRLLMLALASRTHNTGAAPLASLAFSIAQIKLVDKSFLEMWRATT